MSLIVAVLLTLAAPMPLTDSDFIAEFRAAMKTGDRDVMRAVVEADPESAVDHAVDLCEQISRRPTGELEEEIDALRIAYKRAFKSGFVGEMYEYLSLLSPALKKQRAVARTRFMEGERRFAKAVEEDDQTGFGQAATEFEAIAPLFDSLGDAYFSSESWLRLASCFEEEVRGDLADLERVAAAYSRAIAMREKAGLVDATLDSARKRYEELEFAGFGDPSKGPAAREAEKRAAESENAQALAGSFLLIEDIEDFQRPVYTSDANYQIWQSITVSGEAGATSDFPLIEGLTVVRTSSAQAGVDTDADGEADVKVPMTGSISPVKVTIGKGAERRQWAFLACSGKERDTYQSFTYNLQASSKEYIRFYVAAAGSMVVMVGETPVQVIDDNLDGVYGSAQAWSNDYGLRAESFTPKIDSVRVGDEKMARPWSDVLRIADAWYRIEAVNGGSEFVATPTSIETGKVKLDFKGLKPDWFIIKGAEEANANYLFDLAPGGKRGTEVPPGRYELLFGRVSKGKRQQMAKSMILPSSKTGRWTVKAGETITIEMGSPFKFDFLVDQSVSLIQIPGKSIVVTGRGNETYQRFWNCVPHPNVSVRVTGKKKGDKGDRMKPALSQEEILTRGNDIGFAWVPYDFESEKKRMGEDYEVQLAEKKNKLFGKVESDWQK